MFFMGIKNVAFFVFVRLFDVFMLFMPVKFSCKKKEKVFLSRIPHYTHYWNLEALIIIRLKGYYNNTIDVRISLDGHGSKIRKVSRCRPTVSIETILATKQEFFFTKVAPVQSITDICTIGFLIIIALRNFFVKNFFWFFRMLIFQWIQHSNVLVCLSVEK